MRPQPIRALATAPAFVLGLSLIRGAAIPVIDVGALVGAADNPEITRFATLRVGEREVALGVESILGVRDLGEASLQDLPPLVHDEPSEIFSAVGALDDELLLVLKDARFATELADNYTQD